MASAPMLSQPAGIAQPKMPLDQRRPVMDGRDGLRAIPTQRSGPPTRMVIKFLELMCQRHIEAIHTRDFYGDSTLWTDKTPYWEAEIGYLSEGSMNLSQYVKAWQIIAQRYPDYGIHCVSMSTQLNEAEGSAETTADVEITGMPLGVVRKNVVVASCKLVEGKWLATRFSTLTARK